MTECERLISTGFLPESFVKSEVRCDYYVSSKMKKIWAIEVDLLQQLASVCEQLGVTYYAAFGTLLGAVRHQGFIPWDDDVDVVMLRNDYDKFVREAGPLFSEPYFLQNVETDSEYASNILRLRNVNTTSISIETDVCDAVKGIYIDIFPVDGVPKSRIMQKYVQKRVYVAEMICKAYYYKEHNNLFAKVLHSLTNLPFVHFSMQKQYAKMHKLTSKYSVEQSEKVWVVHYVPRVYNNYVFDKGDFTNTEDMPFEYISINVPAGFDSVLKTVYRDYLKFPPVEQRGLWHSIFFDPDKPYEVYKGKRTEELMRQK